MTDNDLHKQARDEAGNWVRTSIRRTATTLGAQFTEQPIFAGARSTETVPDAATGLRAASLVRKQAVGAEHRAITTARGADMDWADIAEVLGLDGDTHHDKARAAYAYAIGPRPTSGDWQEERQWRDRRVHWRCGSCDGYITDEGPDAGGHPVDVEAGHTDSCTRHQSDIAAYEADLDDDDDEDPVLPPGVRPAPMIIEEAPEPITLSRGGNLENTLRAMARENSGETAEQEQVRFAADTLAKCRLVRDLDDAQPWPAWSTGELAAVAAVLNHTRILAAEDWDNTAEALDRAMAGMITPPADPHAWVEDIRAQLHQDNQ